MSYNDRGLPPPNPSAYSDMKDYYQTQFLDFQKMAPPFQEFVWGPIPRCNQYTGYRLNTQTNNYPKLSQLYKADAVLYAKTCNK